MSSTNADLIARVEAVLEEEGYSKPDSALVVKLYEARLHFDELDDAFTALERIAAGLQKRKYHA